MGSTLPNVASVTLNSAMKNRLDVPHDEDKELQRVRAVKRYENLTSKTKKALDDVTHLARQIFHVPIAMVCFVDLHNVFVKSGAMGETPEPVDRNKTLCSRAILISDVTVIQNQEMQEYLLTNPLIAREQGLEFYAAAPLVTEDGLNIGTFCLLDTKNRAFLQEDKDILASFSRIVMNELELCHTSLKDFNPQ